MKKKVSILIFALLAITLISVFIGGYRFENLPHLNAQEIFILTHIRIPRILCVIITGCGLAISGGAIQSLLKNPLAEPSVVGISAGCAVFASLGILLFGNNHSMLYYMLPAMAFGGGIIATVIVLLIGIQAKVTHAIILAGVAINTICSGAISLILALSNNDALRSINFWLMGSFANSTWQQLGMITTATVVGIFVLYRNAQSLDALALGEDDAKMLGVNVHTLRTKVIVTVCFCVGTSVAFFGMVGFVGLVTAHIVRLLFGSSNKVVFGIAPILGSIILLVSDNLARTIILPSELPIGVITSLIGGPFFIYLILRRNANM